MTDGGFPDQGGEIVQFLERKGAVELLCEIHPLKSQFSRLADEIAVSRTTLTKRLNEAEELGIVETVSESGRGTSHAYSLTESGAELRVVLNQSGVTEQYRQLKRLRAEFDQRVSEFQRRIAEGGLAVPPVGSEGFRGFLRQFEETDRNSAGE